eukprot:7294219-Prymnesium_polylepis.2
MRCTPAIAPGSACATSPKRSQPRVEIARQTLHGKVRRRGAAPVHARGNRLAERGASRSPSAPVVGAAGRSVGEVCDVRPAGSTMPQAKPRPPAC